MGLKVGLNFPTCMKCASIVSVAINFHTLSCGMLAQKKNSLSRLKEQSDYIALKHVPIIKELSQSVKCVQAEYLGRRKKICVFEGRS